jgi:hypothetical protein
MSDRIKAGDILTEAFQFGFYRWPSVLRYALVPMIIILLATFGAAFAVFDMDAVQTLENNPDADWEDIKAVLRVSPAVAVLAGLGVGLLTMLLYCGFFASVYRHVALGEERPGLLQVRFDGPAQRVFAALLILNVLNYAVILLLCVVMLLIGGSGFGDFFRAWPVFFSLVEAASADPSYQPSAQELAALKPLGSFFTGLFLAVPALIYLNVKLAPFAPGSAAENRLLLFGAFRMTSGHAWSIFGTLILFVLAMVVMSILYMLTMSFLELMASVGGTMAFIGMIFNAISLAAGIAYQIFVMGVQLSLQAIIYRRLKTGE